MKTFKNIVGKGENAANQNSLLFPTIISTFQNISAILGTIIWSSTNIFNLDIF